MRSASLPTVPPGLSVCVSVGPRGATCRCACPGLCQSESSPVGLSVRECGVAGSASVPFVPHSTSLGPATATRVLSAPCLSLPLLPVWMNVYFLFPWCRTSLPFDFLSVLVVGGGVVCLPMPPFWFLTQQSIILIQVWFVC